jgi:hypothetical protein
MNTTAIRRAIGGHSSRVVDELAGMEVDSKVRHILGSRNAKLWYPAE